MIKAKVKILAWPAYGSESIKPRFSIRGEYQVVQIVDQSAAVLDDHNQIYWIDIGLLSFTEIDGVKIDDLEEYLKKNPEKDPVKAEERRKQEEARATRQQKAKSEPKPEPEVAPEQPKEAVDVPE